MVLSATAIAAPAHSILLLVLLMKGRSVRAPTVAIQVITSLARDALMSGRAARSCATAPLTCGHAMDVPLRVETAVSLLIPAAGMAEPGAKTSTQLP